MKKLWTTVCAILCGALLLCACGAQPASSAVSPAPVPAASLPVVSEAPASEPAPAELTYEEYLAANAVPTALLDGDYPDALGLDGYPVILMGEAHANTKTYTAKLDMIRFLNQKLGVTHVLMEIGYCDAWLVNEYLQTGDESIVESMVGCYVGTFAGNMQEVEYYKSLYAYNQAQPAERRLTVYGGDYQHAGGPMMLAAECLLPEEAPPEALAAGVAFIGEGGSNEELEEWFAGLRRDETAWKAYLGDDWETFRKCVDSFEELMAYYDNGGGNSEREQYMIDRFIEAYETAPDAVWLGLYGGAHTTLNGEAIGTGGEPCLANYLQHTYPTTKGKIGSISLAYYQSQMMTQEGRAEPMEDSLAVVTAAAPKLADDITLCPLGLPGSPFAAPEDISLESQQYLLIIRHSEATEPIGSTGEN